MTLTPFKRSSSTQRATSDVWIVATKGPDCGPHLLLTRGRYSIGRGDCDLSTSDPGLSRHHADLVVDKTCISLLHVTGPTTFECSGTEQKPRLLGVGDEFSLGNTTFKIFSTRAAANGRYSHDRAAPWPPTVTLLPRPASGSRPWLMMATAALPLVIGIILALTMESWFFLAFSAFGLVTGGVPAVIELSARRRLRRRINGTSTQRVREIEDLVPPVGLQVLYSLVRTGTSTYPRQQIQVSHPVRLGEGKVLPPVTLDPASERGPQILPISGPVILTVSAREVGILSGTTAALGPLIRSVVLQLARGCTLANSTLLIVGKTDCLPTEVRFMSSVSASSDVDKAIGQLPELQTSSVVLTTFGTTGTDRLAAAISDIGDHGHPPALIMMLPTSDRTADWSLDVADSRLRRSGEEIIVSLDGISSSTLSQACLATQGELQLPTSDDHQCTGGATPEPQRRISAPIIAWQGSTESSLLSQFGSWEGNPVSLDFVHDGPHVLVAGTTGSGKSELLKAMTLDLICRYGPDQLSMLLLDFKGGATLGPYAETPHCQTLVTDLNAESGERVLDGLRVELQRRESLFREVKAEDYLRYRGIVSPSAAPLPRLLVVVDEFRILSDELPDAVPELMRIATVGRSLGVHLLLATQRPQGVVTVSMRANINTVITLRLLSSLDSNEILGTSAAAELPASLPGLGFMRRAGETPLPFRSLPVEDAEPVWSVQQIGPSFQDCRRVATIHGGPRADSSPAAVLERRTADIPAPRLPVASFAAPLPTELHAVARRFRTQRPPGAIALGLVDDIQRQRLTTLWWTPENQRRIAIVAGPGSSASASLLGLLFTLTHSQPERHIYILDGAGHFGTAAGEPRVAGFVHAGEAERVQELLDVMEAPSTTSYGPAATRILIVSGLAVWASVLGVAEFASLDDRLAGLARTVERQNACVIVIGDRDLVSSRFHALADHRLYLRFGLGQETVMGWPKLKSTGPYPGRAVWTSPLTDEQGVIVQLCTPLPSLPTTVGPPAALPLRRCHRLPTQVAADQLSGAESRLGRYPMGLSAPDHRLWTWTPGRVGLILGGQKTGKSSLLRLIATLFDGSTNIRRLIDPRSAAPDLLLLDEVLGLGDCELAHVDALIRSGTHVVMTAEPDRVGLARLPAVVRMLPPAAILLLNPRQASDGDFPGWRIRPQQQVLPGRALVMSEGTLNQVQCAFVDDGQGLAS